MSGIQISNIGRHRRHSGSTTNGNLTGWNRNWLHCHQGLLPTKASTFSWNVRLARYVKTEQPPKTMELFQKIQQEGMVPDKFTFVPVLYACAQALEEGRCVHLQIMERGFESILYVGNSLIDMYAKCGNFDNALKVFDKMLTHDVVSWNVKCRQAKKALELFQQMQQEGFDADRVFLAVLNAYAIEVALKEGRRIHNHIIQSGYESDVFVGNSLVDMYAECGSIEDAQRVFHKMPHVQCCLLECNDLGTCEM
jgi:pentatricopeptide repeat protein